MSGGPKIVMRINHLDGNRSNKRALAMLTRVRLAPHEINKHLSRPLFRPPSVTD